MCMWILITLLQLATVSQTPLCLNSRLLTYFRSFPEHFEEEINDVYCSKQTIFFSTNNGVYKTNLEDNRIYKILNKKNIYSVFVDHDKNLWLGTNDGGVYIIPNENNNIFRKITVRSILWCLYYYDDGFIRRLKYLLKWTKSYFF